MSPNFPIYNLLPICGHFKLLLIYFPYLICLLHMFIYISFYYFLFLNSHKSVYHLVVIFSHLLPCTFCCCLVTNIMSDSLQPYGLQSTRLLCPWNSSGKNTGVSCHFLLQESFSTQGSNPGLLHCRQIHYHLSHQGNQLSS